ncbi:MAG: galactokinase family protein, partial [Acidobacteriaceae bacterium]
MLDSQRLRGIHKKRFGAGPEVFLAPGRVNLIGEHTDYAGGFVMPAAIDFGTLVGISPRDDGRIVVWSENFQEEVSYALEGLPAKGNGHWSAYPLGVVFTLGQAGFSVGPCSLSIEGDVPLGAGLSSSASIEVATALAALSRVSQAAPGRVEIAKLCQRAENVYVDASCGIMDQFIACNGAEDHALLLDCRSLEFRLAPIPKHVSLV